MNIYEYAMQMEKEGELFYRELAEKTNNEGLKGVLNLLADEELLHYDFIKAMQDGSSTPELTASNLKESAHNVFQKIKRQQINFDFGTSAAEMYRKASKHEEAAYNFYLSKAEEAEDPTHKDIFNKLAEEEKGHMEMMDNMAELVSEPSTWLENAEMTS